MTGVVSDPLHKQGVESGSSVDITYDGSCYELTVTGHLDSKGHVKLSLDDTQDLCRRVLDGELIRGWRRKTEDRQHRGTS